MRLSAVVAEAGLAKKAPFHFVNYDVSASWAVTDGSESPAEYSPAHCQFISQADLQSWLACGSQPPQAHDQQELGIYLPDIYASDFYFLEQQNNYISTMAYMRMINDLLPLDIERYELAFAAFVVLHEYGHWLHFRRCHKSSVEYVLWLNRFLAPVERQRDILDLLPDSEPLKEQLVVEHINAYNAMPQEFSANKYSLKHVAQLYARLLKKTGK